MGLAVVGSGFAGLSLAWYALQKGFTVTVFDTGGGASSVSTGLLHPFPGKTGALSWRGWEGMAASLELLKVAENALGRSVASHTGIFRPNLNLWIPEGVTVFSKLYLAGLMKACKDRGAVFREETFSSKEGFDKVLFATGASTKALTECSHLPLRTAIGQSLLCRWDRPLPFSLAGDGYITLTEDSGLCHVGSTYEHTEAPNRTLGLALLDKVARFYPPAKDFSIVSLQSGVRIAPKDGHQPIIAEVAPNTWVFTGLGSRGLLYHALLGKSLIERL